MSETHTPSETAEQTGFTIDTLRYYERIGLVTEVERTPGGRRAYTDDHLAWLDLLSCLRDTGMPIARMSEYAVLSREEGTAPARLRLLRDHAVEVDERLATLQRQREHLAGKIAWYERELGD